VVKESIMEHLLRVGDIWAQAQAIPEILPMYFFERERRLVINLRDHVILLLEDHRKFGAKCVNVRQISHTNACTSVFIDIGWADTALSAIDLVSAACFFF